MSFVAYTFYQNLSYILQDWATTYNLCSGYAGITKFSLFPRTVTISQYSRQLFSVQTSDSMASMHSSQGKWDQCNWAQNLLIMETLVLHVLIHLAANSDLVSRNDNSRDSSAKASFGWSYNILVVACFRRTIPIDGRLALALQLIVVIWSFWSGKSKRCWTCKGKYLYILLLQACSKVCSSVALAHENDKLKVSNHRMCYV